MPELAYLNGEILPIEKAFVPIDDRGYNFGDAVYEFIATYNGRPFCMEEHLDRLERSMKALEFPPLSRDHIRDVIAALSKRAGIDRAAIYMQISRGVAPRDHAYPEAPTLQFVMTLREIHEKPPELRRDGATAITVTDLRWGRCDIKTVQLLPNVMAKQKALDEGAFDAIFVSDAGVVREATSSNLFIVRNETLVTHPLTPNILPGITRKVILDICGEIGIPAEERFYDTSELFGAREVFLTGTTTEVLPIVRIDGRSIGDGKVGEMSRRIYQALLEKALP
jgi:D-alanine transaminase